MTIGAETSGYGGSPAPQRGGIRGLRSRLPVGAGLPDQIWVARHRGILLLLWAHAAFIPAFGIVRGYDQMHVLLESVPVPAIAAIVSWASVSRRLRTFLTSVGLLTCSAILVHLSGGNIEMHFHFFVMVGVVALYQEWTPFLAAIGYVLVHHGLVGVLDPESVYNHEAAQQGPWVWAGIHAFFIAGASAAALVRWRLSEVMIEERDEAHAKLREESRIVESLHEVGKILTKDLDGNRVVQAVTDAATTMTGAAFGAFFYNVDDGSADGSYMLYTLSGAPREAFDKFGMPRNTDVFGPTFAGTGTVRLDDVTKDPRYGQMAPHFGMPEGHLAVRSYLSTPVFERDGKVLGGLFFGHPDPGRFDEASERIVEGIASHASLALHNAQLYGSEREARALAEVSANRLSTLANASRALFSSLEPEAVFQSVGGMVTAELADFCLIDFLEEDGQLHRVAAGAHSDEVTRLPVAEPPRVEDDDHPVSRAIRDRESQFIAAGSDGKPPAALVVPMVGRHDVLGTLTLGVLQESPTRLTQADLPFAEELARRAALAIENARLYARQRTVAETLQHSLLPERLPELPGVQCAAMYMAGGPGVEVGGDWYDVIPLSGGRLGIAIGDVVGRGERAASLMGQLRNALRAYALDGKDPGQLVNALNVLITDAGTEHMATLIYGVLDPARSVFCFAVAGHPPPLRITASGHAAYLDAVGGLPLGAMAGNWYQESTFEISGGDTIILYTDGLIEERTSAIDAGLARLKEAAGAANASPAENLQGLCEELSERVLDGRACTDDMAILAVRLQAVGERLSLRLPAETNVLGSLRATLRRWLEAAGASEQETFELLVACGEAATNAIRHANGPGGGVFEVEAELDGEVLLTVRDHGRWRNRRGSIGGRGLPIIESYVDTVEVQRGIDGTEVRMRRRLASQQLEPSSA